MRWYRIDWTSGSKSRFHCAKEASVCPQNLMQMFCEFKSCAPDQWVDSRVFSNAVEHLILTVLTLVCHLGCEDVSTETGLIGLSEADLGGKSQVEIETLQLLSWMMIPWQSQGWSLHALVKRNFNLIIFDFKMSPPNRNTQTLKTFENPFCWRKTLCNLGMSQPPFCNAFATVRFVKQCKAVLQCTLTVLVVFSHLIFLSLEKLQVSFARIEKYQKNHPRNSPMQLTYF